MKALPPLSPSRRCSALFPSPLYPGERVRVRGLRHSSFDIPSSFVIRHSSFLLALLLLSPSLTLAADAQLLDLSKALVLSPADANKQERSSIQMLVDEIAVRTQIRPLITHTPPRDPAPMIIAGVTARLKTINPDAKWPAPAGPEGYHIWTDTTGPAPILFIAADDSRGLLFGVGRLLRTLRLSRQKIELPSDINLHTAPKATLRGHQLGYRPKTNSYDGWTVAMWEQYIRDLSVFGCNAIELIPPRSDDLATSPHFPIPQMQMMSEMSRLADDYGLDVWIWYPALDRDYSDAKTVEAALKEWADVFSKLPRIDAVFVPGGDPGHTSPKILMSLLEKQTENLHRFHPKAAMWMSPQGFNAQWMSEWVEIMKQEPSWITGVVYGPQIRLPLPEIRKLIPAKYPLRHYPDITHSTHCQYPVPDWDPAFALTEAREPINPRPTQMAKIYRLFAPHTIGFLTYSEGCNDDVNKTVWSGLGWDDQTDVNEILRDYARYFISPDQADHFAEGLLTLEKNWIGPLEQNQNVEATLKLFQTMEKGASPQMKLNWRFQQALYRAYYDAYIHRRLNYEKKAEADALDQLRKASGDEILPAVDRAEQILDLAATQKPAPELRARVFELAEALFQSIRMQLSVEKYGGISGRGTNLDTIDTPLNNRAWLKQRFGIIRTLQHPDDRMKVINEILNWKNPGPRGFYDDLGNPSQQPHLVRGIGWQGDPDFYASSMSRLEDRFSIGTPLPFSWWTTAGQLFDAPLQMRYTDLDKAAAYRLRLVYGHSSDNSQIRLMANDKFEIHPPMNKQAQPLEFDLPPSTTNSGDLTLTFLPETGRGGNGRSINVAEVWLIPR